MSIEPTKTAEVKEYQINVTNPVVPAGPYRHGLHTPLTKLFPFLKEKEINALLNNKLMLEKDVVDRALYLQAACELTICSWFAHIASRTGAKFVYELKVAPPKDVDCAIWHNGYQFNIEVKCADYEKQRNIVADSDLIMHALGRMNDYKSSASRLQSLFSASPEPTVLGESHHMDCKMKDFLINAQGKFGSNVLPDNLNVLFVCVDDQMDMTKWISYLQGPQGLFMEDSFEPQENYNNVDLVVLTNLYHRHTDVESKSRISAHWDLSKAFNYALKNPKSTKKAEVFDSFAALLPLENNNLIEYVAQADIPDEHKFALGLSHFVGDQIERGIYKFQGYAVDKNEAA